MNKRANKNSGQKRAAMVCFLTIPLLALCFSSVSCVGTRGMGVDVKVYQDESIQLSPTATEPVETKRDEQNS